MTSTFIRMILGCCLMLGLMFPALASAQDTAALQVPMAQEQSADDPTFALEDDDSFDSEARNMAYTVATYTLYGAAVGGVVGLAGYLLSGLDWSPWTIAWFAGGGAVVGAGAGVVVSLLDMADEPLTASQEYMLRDMPTAVQAPVLRLQF